MDKFLEEMQQSAKKLIDVKTAEIQEQLKEIDSLEKNSPEIEKIFFDLSCNLKGVEALRKMFDPKASPLSFVLDPNIMKGLKND